jgi:hypothetical protein
MHDDVAKEIGSAVKGGLTVECVVAAVEAAVAECANVAVRTAVCLDAVVPLSKMFLL